MTASGNCFLLSLDQFSRLPEVGGGGSLAFPYAPLPTSGKRENWSSLIDYFLLCWCWSYNRDWIVSSHTSLWNQEDRSCWRCVEQTVWVSVAAALPQVDEETRHSTEQPVKWWRVTRQFRSGEPLIWTNITLSVCTYTTEAFDQPLTLQLFTTCNRRTSNSLFTAFTPTTICKIACMIVTRQQNQALTSTESSGSWYSLKISSCFSPGVTPNLRKKALLAPLCWVDTNPKSMVVCLASATSLTVSEGCGLGENSTTRGRFRMITFERKVSMSDGALTCGD